MGGPHAPRSEMEDPRPPQFHAVQLVACGATWSHGVRSGPLTQRAMPEAVTWPLRAPFREAPPNLGSLAPTVRQDLPSMASEGGYMAKNTGEGSRKGAVKGRSQTQGADGSWIKRDTKTGRFLGVKSTEGPYKGVRKEK